MRNEIVLVRHSDEPPDDRVRSYASINGLIPVEKFPYRGDLLGNPSEKTLGTVIYGGKFAVNEEDKFPFLLEENRWISACMDANLPVLGLCQVPNKLQGYWVQKLVQLRIIVTNSDISRYRRRQRLVHF